MDALKEVSTIFFHRMLWYSPDAVVGYLKNIIMDDEFQLLQENFMHKYYQEFEDTEENKHTSMSISNEYFFGRKVH